MPEITFERRDHIYGRYWKILLRGEMVGRIVPVGPGSLYNAPREFRVIRRVGCGGPHEGPIKSDTELGSEPALLDAQAAAIRLNREGYFYESSIETPADRVEKALDRSEHRGGRRSQR